jgi:hypothetical protein
MKKINSLTQITISVLCLCSSVNIFAKSIINTIDNSNIDKIDNQSELLFDNSQSMPIPLHHSSFSILPDVVNHTKSEELAKQDSLIEHSYIPTEERINEINEAKISDPYNIEVYYVASSNTDDANKFMHNNMLSFMGKNWDNGTLISTPMTHFSRFLNQKNLDPLHPPMAFANFEIKEPCLKGIPYQVNMHVSDMTEKTFNVEGTYKNITCNASMPNYSHKTSNTQNTNLETFMAKSQYDNHSSTSWVKVELNHDDYLVIRVNKNYSKQY